MPIKDINKRRECGRRSYYKNREARLRYVLERNNRIREQFRIFLRDYKSNTPCKDCNRKYPYYVMDFDHIDNKEFNIANAASYCSNLEQLKLEINKCELVCSNCHRERTYLRSLMK